MIETARNNIEDYILKNKKNINNKEFNKLKNELINEYKKEYEKFYIVKINSNNIFNKYTENTDLSDSYFIVPEYNKKLETMIKTIQDPLTGIELGINIYIKKIENIYKQVHLLNGSILKFI